MSETKRKRPPAVAPEAAAGPQAAPAGGAFGQPAPGGDVRLDVSAQLVTMEPGLFSVELEADDLATTETGMVLPAARLDMLPQTGQARAHLSTLADSPLLLPGSHPAFLRVSGGRVPLLLTIYKLTGAVPPRLRITAVQHGRAGMVTTGDALPRAADAARNTALASLKLHIIVHVAGQGDVSAAGGVWAGAADGTAPIEGFSILPQESLSPDSIEYQAIMGRDWFSPWMQGGEFCGSRKLAFPLLGLRVRLRDAAAASFRCRVWCRFDATELGPVDGGEACESNGAPLQGIRVVIEPK